jgi:L-ascorbate metabolism protein UlaG (beta-lactamase superfamily)
MSKNDVVVTYIGGPTALLEWRGLRVLTDPTFDPAGSAYLTSAYTLRKTIGPAIDAAGIGPIDHAGRTLLASAKISQTAAAPPRCAAW